MNTFNKISKTYGLYAITLTMIMMYPNPQKTNAKRIGALIIFLLCVPQLAIMLYDIKIRLHIGDMENLVRQMVITICLLFVNTKMFLAVLREKELKYLFDTIEADYESYNRLPKDQQLIAKDMVEKTKRLEKLWVFMVGISASSFPLLAFGLTVYSQFTEDPKMYMIHETIMPFIEDKKYSSPYFELQVAYSLFIVWILFLGFSGFDGIFSVCVLHVSLKIKLFSYKLEHLMDDKDIFIIKQNIAAVVKDQCDVYKMVKDIQTCFEIWLAGIFVISVIQTGMALVQTTSDEAGDVKLTYYVFAGITAVHIYLPCYLTSEVTRNAAEVSNYIYSCNWETIADGSVRRSIAIMLARSQKPTYFKAYNMLTFNMELFVSIMQTAYSMYTLLRSS